MRVLDLFCGAGGAAMGLHRAWPDAEIVGVDIKLQKHYPFTFVLGDAMVYPLEGFDFVWASPPCQAYSSVGKQCRARRPGKYHHPDLIDAVRIRLLASGADWVIENVVSAPLRNCFTLCGSQFGLDIRRHRIFESSRFLLIPPCSHHLHNGEFRSLDKRRNGKPSRVVGVHGHINYRGESELRKKAMGIDWMTDQELTQAIPPAYSEFIAKQVPL